VVTAGLAVAIVFFATSPYLILDARAALANFLAQARDQMARVGIDQLGFTGNLAYYLGEAIPASLGWPQYALALLASGALLLRRSFPLLLLPLYVVSLVVGVSLLGIHWQRWAMPVLPPMRGVGRSVADATTRGRSPAWRARPGGPRPSSSPCGGGRRSSTQLNARRRPSHGPRLGAAGHGRIA
jgi:hypothetical protein